MPLSLRQIENEIFENTVDDDSPMFLDDTREEETSEYLLYLYSICEDCGRRGHTKDNHDTGEEEAAEYDLYNGKVPEEYAVCEDCGSSEHTEDDHDRRTDDNSIIR